MRPIVRCFTIVLLLCVAVLPAWHCTPPPPINCMAVAGVVNTATQGDYMLVAHVANREGQCNEEYPSRPCSFDVTLELCVRVPGETVEYRPVTEYPEVVKAFKETGRRLFWSGGEIRGSNGQADAEMVFARSREFRQSVNTGKGYTVTVKTPSSVELYPMTEGKSETAPLVLSTRVALQCAACDGEMPPIVEAGTTYSSWW